MKVRVIILLLIVSAVHLYMLSEKQPEPEKEISPLVAQIAELNLIVESMMLQQDYLLRKFRVDDFKVTGYSNDPGSINVEKWRDGKTATGKKTEHGICASDWKYLPPDSMVWVKGYGWCEVQDRGSAVKGKHIDLFFNDVQQARQWGVQKKEIIIAEAGR